MLYSRPGTNPITKKEISKQNKVWYYSKRTSEGDFAVSVVGQFLFVWNVWIAEREAIQIEFGRRLWRWCIAQRDCVTFTVIIHYQHFGLD